MFQERDGGGSEISELVRILCSCSAAGRSPAIAHARTRGSHESGATSLHFTSRVFYLARIISHAFKSSHLPPNRLSRPRDFASSLGSAAQQRLREMSSSPNHKSPAAGDAGAQADDKPRLTEEEKKQNHIASGTLRVSVLGPASSAS